MSNRGIAIGPGAYAEKGGVAIGHNVYAPPGQLVISGVNITGNYTDSSNDQKTKLKIACNKCGQWLICESNLEGLGTKVSKSGGWVHQIPSNCD